MKLGFDKTYDDKEKCLGELKIDNDSFLRLFYQARNNTIEAACAEIERYLMSHGLKCSVRWSEDSRYHCIKVTLMDKYEHLRYIWLDRKRVRVSCKDAVSELMYSVKSITNSEYYDRKKPKIAELFDSVLGSDKFKELAEEQVLRCNYPFGYNSHTSF